MTAISEHLEAVARGQIKRLLINIPPRASKSSLCCVSFPAWVWAQRFESSLDGDREFPLSGPQVQFLFASYSQLLAQRDSLKTRRLIASPWYQERWGLQIRDDKDTERQFETTYGGSRWATSVGGTVTGTGGDYLIIDDALNAKQAAYETARNDANEWWDESMSTRLNNATWGAKIVIGQRLHEEDLPGHILDNAMDEEWDTVIVPMEYDGDWRAPTSIGWTDPRTEEGELLWPERFPADAVAALKRDLGPFAASGQLQQTPSPKGGGIIHRDWWLSWPAPGFEPQDGAVLTFPACSLIVGSVDTAYGQKDTDAYNAMTVWGVWQDQRERPKTILMEAWRARLPLRGVIPPEMRTDEERKPYWGLAEKIANTIRRRKLDVLLIENKTRGGDLAAELRRLLTDGECMIVMIDPKVDKVARLHACQSMFADGMVYTVLEKAWADAVITEVTRFPKGKYADFCLIAGTMIATRRGPVPIEQVRVGDWCITPAGWRRVLKASLTGICPTTTAAGMTGTLDHPVFTLDRGYQRLDTVTQAARLSRFTLCDLIQILHLNSLSSMDGSSNVWAERENTTLNAFRMRRENQDVSRRGCMSRSGLNTLALTFRRYTRSTTRMATLSIAALTIWSAYRKACIAAYLKEFLIAQRWKRTLLKSGTLLSSGINLMKVALGIEKMQRTAYALPAPHSNKWPRLLDRDVRGAAGQPSRKTLDASFVALCVKGRNQAIGAGSTNSSTPMQPVYNLTIEGEGCYYANGVLVHNTDTTSQALNWMRANHVLQLGTEADVDNLRAKTFKPQRPVPYDV